MVKSWVRCVCEIITALTSVECIVRACSCWQPPNYVCSLGDRLTVVGEAAALQNVEKVLGNAVKSLKEPNLVAVFVGIVLGLALGAIPLTIPGISTACEIRFGWRPYCSRYFDRYLRPSSAYGNLYHPQCQPDASCAWALHVSGVFGT